ncbi:hypothetical protein [Caldibacillus phage CBP1]|nr:hypothetical protein [Caldibacillus phage CBP1]
MPFSFGGGTSEKKTDISDKLLQRLFVASRRPSVPVSAVCQGVWLGGREVEGGAK